MAVVSFIADDDATKGFQWFCLFAFLATLSLGFWGRACNRDDNVKSIRGFEQANETTRTCLRAGNRPLDCGIKP